jgi:hypothetical protein
MGTGAEVRLCVKDMRCRIFCHNNGHPEGIGTELWVILGNLEVKDGEELENTVLTEIGFRFLHLLYSQCTAHITRAYQFRVSALQGQTRNQSLSLCDQEC